MRFRCTALWLLSSLAFAQAVAPTNNSSIDVQAASLVQEANTAQVGANVVQDVQLTGTVVTHFGKDQRGTVTLHADAEGRSQVALNLDSGNRTEYASGLNEDAACTWSSADGTIHKAATHNCSLPASWILPVLSISQGVGTGAVTVQRLSDSPDHLKVQKPFTGDADATTRALIERVSTAEITLDPQSHLPTKMTFNVHPDDDLGRDIPIEIKYSDYRDVNGIKLPFHIEKTMNGSTVLEITIQSATFNTGVQVK